MGRPRRGVGRLRGGMVLVVVLVIVALLSLGALTFSELMMAEREGAEVTVAQSQARALADSGIDMARLFVAQDLQTQQQAGGWYDNYSRFRGVPVAAEGGIHGTGRFTIVAPRFEDDYPAGIRFGLEDESARLNLNMVAAIDQKDPEKGVGLEMLMSLPGMTPDVADAILDWMDLDDEPREQGAEMESYAGLSPGYTTRNGTLNTVEELLLVRGVEPSMLFGLDLNRNYIVDKAESAGTATSDFGNAGSLNSGWASYLTLYGQESTFTSEGEEKIDLNQKDAEELYDALDSALGTDWANFIVAWRQSGGNVPAGNTAPGLEPGDIELDLKQPLKRTLTSVLDLVGYRVRSVRVKGQSEPKIINTPFPDAPLLSNAYLPKLLDTCTVGAPDTKIPRVNINLASRPVLSAVLCADEDLAADLSLREEVVDQIISQRPTDPDDADETFLCETWLYSKLVVTLDQMKKLMPYVCARGGVYRAQAIGYFDRGGPSARVEFVIDATKKPPVIVFWRDMTHLGRGYPLETLGLEALESEATEAPP